MNFHFNELFLIVRVFVALVCIFYMITMVSCTIFYARMCVCGNDTTSGTYLNVITTTALY